MAGAGGCPDCSSGPDADDDARQGWPEDRGSQTVFYVAKKGCAGHSIGGSRPKGAAAASNDYPALCIQNLVFQVQGWAVMKALVSGAAHGLGRALTEELLRQGCELTVLDRDAESLDDLAMSHGEACRVHQIDLSNIDAIQNLLSRLSGQKFDLVILNAGISATGKFEEIPLEAYDRLVAVNLTAPLHLASSLVGLDRMAPKSKIVFVSSLSNAVGYPGAAVYAATKDGLAAYARCVAKPFSKKNVKLLTVFPGPIKTEHARKHAPAGSDESKRMEPAKLANLILKAARRRSGSYYPGGKTFLAALFGKTFPNLATRLMRRGIFDKLDGPSY